MKRWMILLLIFLFVSTAYAANVAWYTKLLDATPSGTDTIMTWDGSTTQTATITSILALGGGGSGDMLAATYDPATIAEQLVGLTAAQTLTNKTLTSPIISTISNTGTLTLPTSTDTIMANDTAATITNKTINGANNTLSSIDVGSLSITGTPDGTKFLRDDDTWVTPSGSSPLTTKGDIYSFTTVPARLAVGTDGYLLCADSSTSLGVKYCGSIDVDIVLEDASSTIDGQLTRDGTLDQLEMGNGASTVTFSNDTVNAAAYHPINGALKTTGEVQALVNILTKAAAYTLGTDESTEVGSSLVIGTAAMVLTLPTASAGYSGCFMAGQGVTAIIQLTPASGDYLVVGGVRSTIATAYASSGLAGDKICYIAANADDWYITSETGTWSE